MSLKRRKALLEFAQTRGAYILEDDYNAEFRFSGPPLPCLQGLDRSGRVIYAGTMSKILYPSLRLGYLLVPPPLADAVAKLRTAIDQHSPTIDQATLARFIAEGFYLSHVRRMRKIYSERREVFIEQFNKLLGDRFTLEIADAGELIDEKTALDHRISDVPEHRGIDDPVVLVVLHEQQLLIGRLG